MKKHDGKLSSTQMKKCRDEKQADVFNQKKGRVLWVTYSDKTFMSSEEFESMRLILSRFFPDKKILLTSESIDIKGIIND